MQKDFAKKSRFQNTYTTLDSFLANADDVLRGNDPNQSAEEELIETRIGQLRDLTKHFSYTQNDLDSLNLIGYRMPLSEDDSKRLKTLNQKWYSLSSDTAERFKTMQGHLLLQQDFSEKCQAWMSFLEQVENRLAAAVSGTYDGLLDQQKAHEVTLCPLFCHTTK
jgi:nesprin-1